MASSSVSQEDHDVEHDFALASRRAKVRSARANRAVNVSAFVNRADDVDKDGDGDRDIPKYEQTSVVLVEQNEASPKPVSRGLTKTDSKRPVPRGAHAGKSNKGARDRRKLREKRRSTGVMHLPSTESTGGSTGEDENNENSLPPVVPKPAVVVPDPVEKVILPKTKSDSDDLDADDEGNTSADVRGTREDHVLHMKTENERLMLSLECKEKRVVALEIQVAQLKQQLIEIREENAKLLRAMGQKQA